jgi:hypothetical protein
VLYPVAVETTERFARKLLDRLKEKPVGEITASVEQGSWRIQYQNASKW